MELIPSESQNPVTVCQNKDKPRVINVRLCIMMIT